VTTTPVVEEFERMAALTFSTRRHYDNPFADIEVSVVFVGDGGTWRVPAFWRGGRRWTVRFAPPRPGRYRYSVETTDPGDTALNGRTGAVTIRPYSGSNPLLMHGVPQVSRSGRHFEHADGTPFFWLGESWYSGLSTRVSWAGFKKITRDRRDKGFTVVEMCAGLAVTNEEDAPVDPPFRNEGGAVWDPEWTSLNPRFFDYADRRIEHLIDSGIAPAIIGGWNKVLTQMGIENLKRHWRYVVARYGAYPVFWIVGGEIYDPAPEHLVGRDPAGTVSGSDMTTPGWTEVARYVRDIDPYHRPLSSHEYAPPFDTPLADETLKDFDLFQTGHVDWPSIPTQIGQVNLHYSRRTVRKPLVQGEIGYENYGSVHLDNFQRAAYWTCMLNGAAGFSYGTVETASFLSNEQPWARVKMSFYSWEDALDFPGSRQVGLAAQLLRTYRWWEFAPHPDWVDPAGTTLLEPRDDVTAFGDDIAHGVLENDPVESLPRGPWAERAGNWRLPYAAGVPGHVRIIYLPYFGSLPPKSPLRVRALEPDSTYRSFYWQPALGIRIDVGTVTCHSDGSGSVDLSRIERRVLDAGGIYRGEIGGRHWDDFGTGQTVEDFVYTPPPPPTVGDWVLVLEGTVDQTL
jgi:hypothetical protein